MRYLYITPIFQQMLHPTVKEEVHECIKIIKRQQTEHVKVKNETKRKVKVSFSDFVSYYQYALDMLDIHSYKSHHND